MPRSLPLISVTELMKAYSGEFTPILATIMHSTFLVPFYVCNDILPIISNRRWFHGWRMDIQVPSDTLNEIPGAQISMDNVDPDGTIEAAIQSLADKDPAIVTLEFIRKSDPDTIIATWPSLKLRNVKVANTIAGRLTYEDVLNEPLCAKQTPYFIPGAFGGIQQS